MKHAERKEVKHDSSRGLHCPKCGGDAVVSNSRPIAEAVRRRRVCAKCGHRFTTREQII